MMAVLGIEVLSRSKSDNRIFVMTAAIFAYSALIQARWRRAKIYLQTFTNIFQIFSEFTLDIREYRYLLKFLQVEYYEYQVSRDAGASGLDERVKTFPDFKCHDQMACFYISHKIKEGRNAIIASTWECVRFEYKRHTLIICPRSHILMDLLVSEVEVSCYDSIQDSRLQTGKNLPEPRD